MSDKERSNAVLSGEINIGEQLNPQSPMTNPDERKKKTEELSKEISDKTKELQEIRSECSHKEGSEIKMVDGSLVKLCKTCGSQIGYPNKDEQEQWMK